MKYIVIALVFFVVYFFMSFLFLFERLFTIVVVIVVILWNIKIEPEEIKSYWLSFNLTSHDEFMTIKDYWSFVHKMANVSIGNYSG